jgi:hypothetical protein
VATQSAGRTLFVYTLPKLLKGVIHTTIKQIKNAIPALSGVV